MAGARPSHDRRPQGCGLKMKISVAQTRRVSRARITCSRSSLRTSPVLLYEMAMESPSTFQASPHTIPHTLTSLHFTSHSASSPSSSSSARRYHAVAGTGVAIGFTRYCRTLPSPQPQKMRSDESAVCDSWSQRPCNPATLPSDVMVIKSRASRPPQLTIDH